MSEDVPFWRLSHSVESHFLHLELLGFPDSRLYWNALPQSQTAYQGCLFQGGPPWPGSRSDPPNDMVPLPVQWSTWIWASLPGLSFPGHQSGSTMAESSRGSRATLLCVLGTRERYSGPCWEAERGLKNEGFRPSLRYSQFVALCPTEDQRIGIKVQKDWRGVQYVVPKCATWWEWQSQIEEMYYIQVYLNIA